MNNWRIETSRKTYITGEDLYYGCAYYGDVITGDGDSGVKIAASILEGETVTTSVYVQGAEMEGYGLSHEKIEARCSCMASELCRHAVCLLLKLEDHLLDNDTIEGINEKARASGNIVKASTEISELPDFFNTLETGTIDHRRKVIDGWLSGITDQKDRNAEQIRWTFSFEKSDDYPMLGAFRVKRLKSGLWSRGQRYFNIFTLSEQLPKCAETDDQNIARMLLAQSGKTRDALSIRRSNNDTWIPLTTGIDELFNTLLETGRFCMSHAVAHPLRLGQSRAASLQWIGDVDERRLQLKLIEPQDDIAILPFARPWYIDRKELVMGPVTTTVPSRILDNLNKMPSIKDADVPVLVSTLQAKGCTVAIPEDVQRVEICKPTAVALITNGEMKFADVGWYARESMWRYPCAFLTPAVRYGAHVFPVFGREYETLIGDVSVRRDVNFEIRMLKRLADCGLVSQHSTDLEISPKLSSMTSHSYITKHKNLCLRTPTLPDSINTYDDDGIWQLPVNLPAQLIAAGWELQGVEVPEEVLVGADAIEAVFEEDGDWFQLSLGIMVDGEHIDLVPALVQLIDGDDWEQIRSIESADSNDHAHSSDSDEDGEEQMLVPLPGGRILRAPRAPLQRIAHHLYELLARNKKTGDDGVRLTIHDRDLIDALDGIGARLQSHEGLISAAKKLQSLAAGDLPAVSIPKTFVGTLRSYQEEGVAWMHALREARMGGLLADDMGLGKTVMTIAFCAFEKSKKRLQKGALIIAPRSMIGVWQREFQKFAPTLKVYVYHGEGRSLKKKDDYDVLCTTYATATRDIKKLYKHEFDVVVCDEAQALKNSATKATKAINTLDTDWRLALTGTPMENHLGELWSLMRWLNAGLFGSEKHFSTIFRKPIEKDGDPIPAARLRRRIAPVMLRRSKDIVATELPEKTINLVTVEMGKHQRELYESIRIGMDERLQEAIAVKGLEKSGLLVLEALLRLRQVCCDPSLIKTDAAQAVHESAKLEQLMDMLPTMVADGRRILLFSQFTGMLKLIGKKCEELGLPYKSLTGQTRKRQPLIDGFQNHEFPIFLISLKAGGTGLTLTAADTVIHYDPWWNPAAEDQATDRAHRIGQKNPVFVYRFIAAGSVEERIDVMQERKRSLAAGLYGEDGQVASRLSEKDIEELFKPLG